MSARWKPLPASLPSPTRELAERMRTTLDRTGLSLRRLAADDEVHYSVTALQRFFSGQAQPPRQLVDVLASRCRDDSTQLLELYERARAAAAEPGHASTRNGAAERPIRRPHRMIAIGAALFAAGLVAGIAAAPCAFGTRQPDFIPISRPPTGNHQTFATSALECAAHQFAVR